MSENEEHTDLTFVPEDDIEVETDKALTMRAERLAGSPTCLNCGTGLKGPFCYYCGQPDRNFFRFFPALLRELMSDFLDLDSRFARTMKPLLFKPGRLTRDYLEGRRFRYTPPMRLYLFSSIAFFLLAALLSSNAITTTASQKADSVTETEQVMSDEERAEKIQQAMEQIPDDVKEEFKLEIGNLEIDGTPDGDDENMFESGDISFNGEPWNKETNPVDIQWLPIWLNDWINDEVEKSPDKAKRINENPNLIVEQVFDILPATMFVLLPFVALIFKFWYLFAKRFYVEHLIFALHNHAFIFVSLMLMLLLSVAEGLLEENGLFFTANLAEWLVVGMAVWIPIYLLVSLRHVYQQNWFFTVIKFGAIGISYVTLLGLTTSVVAILSFVLLN
jgi:hypothetical protein